MTPRALSLGLTLAALAAFAPSSWAQAIKPGLWELKQTMQADAATQAKMAEAQKHLQSMPPEQRKMIEQMMAKNGVNVNLGTGAVTIKACITKEQAELNTVPFTDRARCTHQSKRSGNQISTHFSCAEPESVGDSVATLKGNDAFTGTTQISVKRGGTTEVMKMNSEGRWLGAACGEVQPMPLNGKP